MEWEILILQQWRQYKYPVSGGMGDMGTGERLIIFVFQKCPWSPNHKEKCPGETTSHCYTQYRILAVILLPFIENHLIFMCLIVVSLCAICHFHCHYFWDKSTFFL